LNFLHLIKTDKNKSNYLESSIPLDEIFLLILTLAFKILIMFIMNFSVIVLIIKYILLHFVIIFSLSLLILALSVLNLKDLIRKFYLSLSYLSTIVLTSWSGKLFTIKEEDQQSLLGSIGTIPSESDHNSPSIPEQENSLLKTTDVNAIASGSNTSSYYVVDNKDLEYPNSSEQQIAYRDSLYNPFKSDDLK